MGVDTVGKLFAFCTKHKSGKPTLWPAPFLRALSQRTYPGPIFLFLCFIFLGKKINYAIVYTPGCIRRRGISVLKRPGVNWGYFSVFGFLFGGMYSWPTPWNVIPTFDLRQTRSGCACWGDSCLPYVASAQSGQLSSCFPLGNKATKTVLFIGTVLPQQTWKSLSKSDSLLV